MFDITPEDISRLNDVDLRELVARLCEAELAERGHSPAAVTWGGSQTAADGGLDVRIELPPNSAIDGFIPRGGTGFQVKKPDMPRAEIEREMRPGGTLRQVIQELADSAGSYVIISSTGSTADSALRNRRKAMRDFLADLPNADRLHTDFYDRTRVASWVRRHPGVVTWARQKVGRSLRGWQPYGEWSGPSGTSESSSEYLVDETLRLHFAGQPDEGAQSAIQATDKLRDTLRQPGKIVRLVGLSGVGKTRFVQALFEPDVGARPLPTALAVYTNLSDDPDPQPTGLASDLIANRVHAVLVVDNCPPDLHRRLSEACSGQRSTISAITIEYDVRDDQPEGTEVVTLDTSSPELIQKLIRRRYHHISQVDARTIAEAAGGNARIAIAIAGTVGHSESIADFSNDELFDRLFRQRHDSDNALLRTAQACSLVYSFDGESLAETDSELSRVAGVARLSPEDVYSHVAELTRRNLVQHRGVWRAVLPHAIANRLAARALDDVPYAVIDSHIVQAGMRLLRSFSRRLSYLHTHAKARAIAADWLAPNGRLADVARLDEDQCAIFENLAAVLPEAALVLLEQADSSALRGRYLTLLRSLAYDSDLFGRSARVLARAATQVGNSSEGKKASDVFVSLFTIVLSGTHATIQQRLSVIEWLLRAPDEKSTALGLLGLEAVLKTTHFSSHYRFEFGARSRDFGSYARTPADAHGWYAAALGLLERLALTDRVLESQLRSVFARHLRTLWAFAHMFDEVERLSRAFAGNGFWREGWAAYLQILRFDSERLGPEAAERAQALEAKLRPATLSDRVRAVVLGGRSSGVDLEDIQLEGDEPTSSYERHYRVARELGTAVACDEQVFSELLPEFSLGGFQAFAFGRGLASDRSSTPALWRRLLDGLERADSQSPDGEVLRGFIAEVWERDRPMAESMLDSVVGRPAVAAFTPAFHSAIELDERGVERIKTSVSQGHASVWHCRSLAYGPATDRMGGSFKDLVLFVADQPDGFPIALEILSMRLHSDTAAKQSHSPAVLEAGRDLLRRVSFRNNNKDEFDLAAVIRACLQEPQTAPVVAEFTGRLKEAIRSGETYGLNCMDVLKALFETQPGATLDALFAGSDEEQQLGVSVFEFVGDRDVNPLDVVPPQMFIDWCERDRQNRYELAASVVDFARPPVQGEGSSQSWSEQAIALLTRAPEPTKVLEEFVRRFRPMSWSGSRAAIIEGNAKLLDSLDAQLVERLGTSVSDARQQLVQDIKSERASETREDRARDERFE